MRRHLYLYFGGALRTPPDKSRPLPIQVNAGIHIATLEVHPQERALFFCLFLLHRIKNISNAPLMQPAIAHSATGREQKA